MKTLKRILPRPKTKIIIMALITLSSFMLFQSCSKQEQYEDGITQDDIERMKDEHLISLDEAVKLYDKYTNDRAKILKDTLRKKYKDDKFKITRTVWVDINSMRAYLKYLENNTKEAQGLAFYFGVNNEKKDFKDEAEKEKYDKKKNHETFFIAPTIENVYRGDTIQSGYTVDKKGNRIFLYTKYSTYGDPSQSANKDPQRASFLSLQPGEDGYLFNEGIPNPPGENN